MPNPPAPASRGVAVAVYQLPPADDDALPAVEETAYDVQRSRALLRQNADWFCRLRWIVVVVLAAAGALSLSPWTRPLGLPLAGSLLAAAAALAAVNLVYRALLRRLPEPAPEGRLRGLLWLQIVFDLAVLTTVIHLLGSQGTYAPFTYLFHIILACIFFPRRESLAVAGVAAALYAGCLLVEYAGLFPPRTLLTAAARAGQPLWIWNFASLLVIWAIIWYLASRLATALRKREHELAAINRRLEASSQERARHMLQTTHQLKAPFAAIHANTQLLLGGYCGELPEPSRKILEKIAARSEMLSQQIQDMLQLANLQSRAQTSPATAIVNLARLVELSIARLEPMAALRGIRIESDLESVSVPVIEDYLRMLIDNLLGNAVSYSCEGGLVGVLCRPSENSGAVFVVRDHGIGIRAEKVSHVFDDYYRTSEAAGHNKASTGLGLAIVRHVARALKMSVKIESAPGWGTRVTVRMPALMNSPTACLSHDGVANGLLAHHR